MQPFTYLKPHYESHITEYQPWLRLWVKQPVHVSVGDLTKQDIIIADKTGRATLTFWESNVETVMANLLYHFNNIIVCQYQGNKYLSLPKKDASVSNIPDIGDVSEEGPQWVWRWRSHNTRGWSYQRVNLADVPGMCSMQSQTANNNWNLDSCTKCEMQQKLARCPISFMTELLVSLGTDNHTLFVFGSNIKDIAEQEEITAESLLSTRLFTFTYTNNVVTTISWPAWILSFWSNCCW